MQLYVSVPLLEESKCCEMVLRLLRVDRWSPCGELFLARLVAKEVIELMNKSPRNFERLVLVCIDSYDSEKRRILQHFSRSTRLAFLCTAQISNFRGEDKQSLEKLKKHGEKYRHPSPT